MRIKIDDINKYQSIVLKSPQASRLLTLDRETSHCLLLQSEDCLFLDIVVYLYVIRILQKDGDDISSRLQSSNIPDVVELPLGEKVVTEDISRIIETAYLTPTEFERKVYIIDKCETMNDSAQNKLLKLLEEPPSSCIFILKSNSKFALLPTIRSRSELIEFTPLPVELLMNVLPSQLDADKRNLIAATSFGRLSYAEEVMVNEKYTQIEALVFDLFDQMKKSGDMLKYSYQILKFKDYLDTVIFYIECVLHDCLVYCSGQKQKIYFSHRERQIAKLSIEYTTQVSLALQKNIKRARLRIKGYGNATAVVDELLFSMLEEKTKWQKL